MERFTQGAREVLLLAQEAAEQFNHKHIATEHLLLGILREGKGVAARTLLDLGVSVDTIESLVRQISGERTSSGRLDLTPGTKKALELAVDEARKLGHHYIGTEHLLLGLVRQNEETAIYILKSLYISPEEVRSRMRRLLSEASPQSSSPSAPGITVSQRPVTSAKTPLLDQLSVDLTAQAESGELDPFVGRDAEITRIAELLFRRKNNGVLLIGAPGVGKTAIIEGLAQRILAKTAPSSLLGKRLLVLRSDSLIAGTYYRGQFEERLRRVIDEVQTANAVLFVDQALMLVSLNVKKDDAYPEKLAEGMPEGKRLSAADIFKPALEGGLIHLIGAMTAEEYTLFEDIDPVLALRFGTVQINEPSLDEAIQMARTVKSRYEAHHHVTITDEAVSAAVSFAVRHLPDHVLPGKAISLLDKAASRANLGRTPDSVPEVTPRTIAEVVSFWTGVPITTILDEHS